MTQSVAERNVEVVREVLEAINRGGSAGIFERMAEFTDPEVEWRGVATGREAPGGHVVYHGYEGLRRYWEDIDEVFEEIHFGDLRIEAFGDDVVLALMVASGVGHGSGIRLEQEVGVVYRVKDGRILSGENFASPAEAEARARELAEETADA